MSCRKVGLEVQEGWTEPGWAVISGAVLSKETGTSLHRMSASMQHQTEATLELFCTGPRQTNWLLHLYNKLTVRYVTSPHQADMLKWGLSCTDDG